MSTTRQKRGLLAHSAKAGEDRRNFMAMRGMGTAPLSGSAQLKFFLLHSRAGMNCILVFAAIMLYSGVIG